MLAAVAGPPSVWIGCVSCFNEGRLVGRWGDAEEACEVAVDDLHDGQVGEGCGEMRCLDCENLPCEVGELSPGAAVAGLAGGIGMVLVWLALTTEPPQWRSERQRRLADLLVQAGVGRTSPAVFVAGSAALGVVAALGFLGVSRAWSIAIVFGVIAAVAPYVAVSSRARSRRTRLREVWPEAVDTLVSGVRAGMSLPEALGNLGERGPDAVREQFRAFAVDYAATARFAVCLDRLKARFADPVADRIVEALRLAHEVGGSELGVLLRSLSHMLREDLRTRGELEARQSWTVNGARVAVAAPWLVLALLSTRPQAAAAYATSTGALILAVGAVASVLAYRLMLRLGRLPEEERVLR